MIESADMKKTGFSADYFPTKVSGFEETWLFY
jgi:hypothetical protein